ncbi:DUF2690 domain-containing protein [Dactylosporangium sp. NBC_01737]|uniref:DUF2690 domain-containing protein n=1 Tax=Dactylosporangium sp. NBC_01737 TaxID=2975959 RepID=UPI002E0FADE0|nr:DUF2690 domain-containing protein [Dactylosporangium sp. NBC_01737]
MTGQNGSFAGQASADDRLTEFVADLAELRREAGQPSLRKMAGASHYSHTALSSVLSGMRLPSQELTLAFVRACGGDDQAWRERWRREHDLLHGPAAAPGPSSGPSPASGAGSDPAADTLDRRRLALTVGIAALVVVLVLAVAAATGAFTSGQPTGQAASPQASAPPAGAPDGSDPQEQRCQLDAVSARTVPIPGPDASQPAYGSLTLRYSPHCHAAWPLFVSSERVPTGATIRLRASRPSDGAASEFDYPYMVRPQVFSVFGNVLQTARGCVSVAVEITAPQNAGALATAETPCLQPS